MRDLEASLQAAGYRFCVGIDEAGRGPLAGPVVAAAVHIPLATQIEKIGDSKGLSPQIREKLCEEIYKYGQVGVGLASPKEIDELNILQATFLAMRRAVMDLGKIPEICLVDGNQPIPNLNIPQRTVVRGDSTCFIIAAASIVAKVTRDRIMCEYEKKYPGYGFAQHKGYPTKQHLSALVELGPSPIHRFSFRSVKRGNIHEVR